MYSNANPTIIALFKIKNGTLKIFQQKLETSDNLKTPY